VIERGPAPTAWSVGDATAPDGTVWYLLTFATPVGEATYWFPREGIEAFRKALDEVVSGLILPKTPPSADVVEAANRAERRRRERGIDGA
jgi:hypothetical protein